MDLIIKGQPKTLSDLQTQKCLKYTTLGLEVILP